MHCVECFQVKKIFFSDICFECYPGWYKSHYSGFKPTSCTFTECRKPVVSYLSGLCKSHRTFFWQNGGKNIRPSKWDNPDGTRKLCSAEGCQFVVESSGLCTHHYQNRHYENGRGKLKKVKYQKKVNYDGSPVLCGFEDCGKPVFNNPWCAGHYYQNLRGENLTVLNEKSLCEVFGCENLISVKLNADRVCRSHSGLARRFSLSVERLFDFFKPGNRVCGNPGCGSLEDLHMDHDHSCCAYVKNGKRSCGECVRGWLCRGCNISLGLLKENPRRIQGLLLYLGGSSTT